MDEVWVERMDGDEAGERKGEGVDEEVDGV